jgi:peptide/nickel transport system substrate-binding protein
LLVEAGYPDGFSVTLDCAKDWGDDEIAACGGMAKQLGGVGIKVAIEWLSTDEYDAKVYNDRESDFHIDGWHMDPDSEELLKRMYDSEHELNVVGYANPRIDELIDRIEGDLCDTSLRRRR